MAQTKKSNYVFLRSLDNTSTGKRDLVPISGQTAPDGRDLDSITSVSFRRTTQDGTEGPVTFYPEKTVFAAENPLYNPSGTMFLQSVPFPVELPAGYRLEDQQAGTTAGSVPSSEGDLFAAESPAAEQSVPVHKDLLGVGPAKRQEMRNAWKLFQEERTGKAASAAGPAEPVKTGKKPSATGGFANIRALITANHPCPTVENDGFYVDPAKWKYIVRNIMKHVNVMLTGPSGTGKTELLMLAAKQLGIPCSIYDMGGMQDPMTQLLGTHRIVNGNSVFEYSRFAQDIQKPGLIILDEISRADPMTNNILFRLLDSRRELAVEQAGENQQRVIKVHPDCSFAATANIGDEYVGTRELDPAVKQRFLPSEMTFPPSSAEQKLLQNRCGIEAKSALWIVKTATLIRERCRSHNLGADTSTASTRETLAVAELVSDGWSVVEAMETILLPRFCEEDRDTVRKLFIAG